MTFFLYSYERCSTSKRNDRHAPLGFTRLSTMSDQTINNPRAEIDAIDSELLRLLNQRAEIALRVGAAKTSVDTSLCDPNREREVLARLSGENPGPFDDKSIENIFQRVIDESLSAGEHSLAWNARRAGLGTGSYYLRLEAGGTEQTRKFSVLR